MATRWAAAERGSWVGKYADIWAAIAPISGPENPAAAEKVRHLPIMVVHGDADTVVPVEASRHMVEALKKLDADVKYVEVPGGSHGSVSEPNMAAIFDFFAAHVKTASTASNARASN